MVPAPAITQKIEIKDKQGKRQAALGHRMDPKSESVYEGVAIDRDHVYLLVKGPTRQARRIIDQHRSSDGAYEGAYQIARTARGFAVLINDPTPRIELLEWVPTGH